MNLRKFGKTGRMVSEIGLGTWQLGTKWGEQFNESEAMRILETAADCGITLIDTADIYNKSNSELTIGKFLSKHKGAFYVVTKCGRGLNPHVAEGYTPENVEHFIDNSLGRLGVEQLDMVLLHCPPSSVYCKDELFSGLDKIVDKGKIAAYGVSVEKVSEGLKAMDYNISAIEVIFNMFRLKPLEKLLPEAKERDIGILARVPLASGLLTGKFNKILYSDSATTEILTDTANRSIRVKPFPASITKRDCRRSKSLKNFSVRRILRRTLCAGYSCTMR